MKRTLFLPIITLALLVGCVSPVRDVQNLPIAEGARAGVEKAAIQTELSDGAGIAALINKNYNEDTDSCTEYITRITRGYYFCTGVLLRTTDNGNFNPWEPSATALTLRATSYSWIRRDLKNEAFYKRAGYILLNPADVLAEAVPGVKYLSGRPPDGGPDNPAVQCVYPLDAWTTRTMDRNYLGCNFEGTGLGHPNPGYPWGSCDDSLGFTTASHWDNHFSSNGQVKYKQCSWNSDNQQGWRNMISSHNSFAGRNQSFWNEVMINNWGPAINPTVNEIMRTWIVAFFYDAAKAGALADAKAFQQKMANTGKRVPILRIDFKADAPKRFQFRFEDQVAAAYP